VSCRVALGRPLTSHLETTVLAVAPPTARVTSSTSAVYDKAWHFLRQRRLSGLGQEVNQAKKHWTARQHGNPDHDRQNNGWFVFFVFTFMKYVKLNAAHRGQT